MAGKKSTETDGPEDDRRAERRTATVYRPALVEIGDFAGFCLIRNLSSNGMMASVFAEFAPEQPVTVHFSDGMAAPGRVVWSEGERIGIEFEREINVAEVLLEQDGTGTGEITKRAPRLPIDCEAELMVERTVLLVHVLDISQRGIKVTGALARTGDEVEIRLPDMEPRKAVVRWAKNATMGLNFLRPFGFTELAEWVVDQQLGQAQKDVRGAGQN